MAAYAATVTIKGRKAWRTGPGGFGILRGRIDITNYNSTLVELTGITGKFKDNPTVNLSSASDAGTIGHWVDASKSVKCYVTSTGVEVANDADGGAFDFIAMGLV